MAKYGLLPRSSMNPYSYHKFRQRQNPAAGISPPIPRRSVVCEVAPKSSGKYHRCELQHRPDDRLGYFLIAPSLLSLPDLHP